MNIFKMGKKSKEKEKEEADSSSDGRRGSASGGQEDSERHRKRREAQTFQRAELVHKHKELSERLRQFQAQTAAVRGALQTLYDCAADVPSYCLCCAVNDLGRMILDCIHEVDRIENDEQETDPETHLLGSAKRFSITEHQVMVREKQYRDMSLKELWEDIKALEKSARLAEVELSYEKGKVAGLQRGYLRYRYQFWRCRHNLYKGIIDDATRDALTDC